MTQPEPSLISCETGGHCPLRCLTFENKSLNERIPSYLQIVAADLYIEKYSDLFYAVIYINIDLY